MNGVNKVILMGHVGKNCDVQNFANGGMIAKTTLATTKKWKDSQTQEQKSDTQWHNLTFRNKLAEIAQKYITKGKAIYIEGFIKYGSYDGQDGVKKYTVEIVVNEMQLLPNGNKQQDSHQFNSAPPPADSNTAPDQTQPKGEDDLPF